MTLRLSASFSSAILIAASISGTAAASGSHEDGHGRDAVIGQPGDASVAARTVEIMMGENFFNPASLSFSAGETVRFIVKNEGDLLHEFNIGTPEMHEAHEEEMMSMMEQGMMSATGINHDMMQPDGQSTHAHDDPNSALVEPGQSEEMVWTFTEATELEFACNIPGHYTSGMVGDIRVSN